MYTNLGTPNIRPYFSRKIGLTDDGQPIPLIGGARLNGYLNTKTRIEVMDMQSGQTAKQLLPELFYLGDRATGPEEIQCPLILYRSEFFGDSTFKSGYADKYNRVAGS